MKINGKDFYNMTRSAASLLDQNKVAVNNMNVFPVPDGDTGINMTLTLSSIGTLEGKELPLGEYAKCIADTALRSARGNSGAILSLFFRGMAKALAGKEDADAKDIADAFEFGTKEAYKAVASPTEGTILTVMRRTSEIAREVAGYYGDDLVNMMAHLVTVADTELARTPELLPVLAQAKVVDAGGYGFVILLQGMLSALRGEVIKASPSTESAPQAADFAQFDSADVTFSYCTECIVQKSADFIGEGKVADFYRDLSDQGDSLVFVDDEEIIKLHIHTDHPGKVLEKALAYGSLATVKIENMRLQHSAKVVEEVLTATTLKIAPAVKKYGFVAVAMGEGIERTFCELGVDGVVFGGQTMNPSTQDILDAIYKTPSEVVFVFPNNKNILLVAKEAAKLCEEKQVVVVPTRNVPQGITSLLVFDEGATAEENLAAMTEAMARVTCITTTHAVRDSEIDGLSIQNGQAMGLVNEKIKCVGETSAECIGKLTEHMMGVTSATVFYGAGVSEADAEAIDTVLRGHLSDDTDIILIDGGQNVYEYIISLE